MEAQADQRRCYSLRISEKYSNLILQFFTACNMIKHLYLTPTLLNRKFQTMRRIGTNKSLLAIVKFTYSQFRQILGSDICAQISHFIYFNVWITGTDFIRCEEIGTKCEESVPNSHICDQLVSNCGLQHDQASLPDTGSIKRLIGKCRSIDVYL